MPPPPDPQLTEKVLDKLKKLLRLSSSPNENEAALALEKAQELAIQHGIELAAINTDDSKLANTPIREVKQMVYKGQRKWICKLLTAHFNVGIAYNKKEIWFYGTRSDIDFALYLMAYLENEFSYLWKLAKYKNSEWKDSNSYFQGLTDGISQKLTLVAAKSQQWGLIVRDKNAAIRQLMEAGNINFTKNNKRHEGDEYMAGYADKDKINFNRPIEDSGKLQQLGS